MSRGQGSQPCARCVLRMTSIDGGTVRYGGADVYAMSASVLRQARRRMQVVFQDPYSSLNRSHDVEGIVGSPLAAYHVGSREARRSRVADLLEMVGPISPQLARRRPLRRAFRGQAQRVAIARALALEPELIVLDEGRVGSGCVGAGPDYEPSAAVAGRTRIDVSLHLP